MEKAFRFSEGADAEKEFKEFKKDYKLPKSLRFDSKKKEILLYTDDGWEHFQETIQPWIVTPEEIEAELAPKFFPDAVVIRLPKKETEEFLVTPLSAWKLDKDDLKCYAGLELTNTEQGGVQ